jgi:uncharacterized membrane protein
MTDLVVIAYREQSQADDVIAALHRLQADGWIEIEDAAYITVESDGRVKAHQDRALTQEKKESGPLWGSLLKMLFASFPVIFSNVPTQGLAGALAYDVASSAIGVSSGISATLANYGFDETFIQQLRTHMLLNRSTVFVVVRNVTLDKVIDEISKYGGTVLYTTFPYEILQQFQENLSGEDGN